MNLEIELKKTFKNFSINNKILNFKFDYDFKGNNIWIPIFI